MTHGNNISGQLSPWRHDSLADRAAICQAGLDHKFVIILNKAGALGRRFLRVLDPKEIMRQ